MSSEEVQMSGEAQKNFVYIVTNLIFGDSLEHTYTFNIIRPQSLDLSVRFSADSTLKGPPKV